jgi:hypothetical protein
MTHIPRHFDKEILRLLQPALDAGCTYRVTGGQHIMLANPANGRTLTVGGRKPSWQQPRNLKRQIVWLLELTEVSN